jgi:hypothetical protein
VSWLVDPLSETAIGLSAERERGLRMRTAEEIVLDFAIAIAEHVAKKLIEKAFDRKSHKRRKRLSK